MQRTPHSRARLAGALALVLAAGAAFAAETSPAGTWKTIDDNTGKQKGEVTIIDNGGTFTGKVSKILVPGDESKTCTKCTDDRKDQPIQGMTILKDLKANGNNNWDGGNILDPENGKVYSAKMSLDETGNKLTVRGFIGISLIGRSQTWIRQQ